MAAHVYYDLTTTMPQVRQEASKSNRRIAVGVGALSGLAFLCVAGLNNHFPSLYAATTAAVATRPLVTSGSRAGGTRLALQLLSVERVVLARHVMAAGPKGLGSLASSEVSEIRGHEHADTLPGKTLSTNSQSGWRWFISLASLGLLLLWRAAVACFGSQGKPTEERMAIVNGQYQMMSGRESANLSIINCNGFLCECLQVPAGEVVGPAVQRKFQTIFVMVTGNPGCIEFYDEFLNCLNSNTDPTVAFTGVSFAGHSHRNLTGTATFNLQQQIQHVRNFVGLVASLNPDAEIVMAGHSIGAYVCLRVMANPPPEVTIAKVVGLLPTIANLGISSNGKKLKYLFMPVVRQIIPWIGGLAGYMLPMSVKKFIVRCIPESPSDLAADYHKLVPNFLNYTLGHNAFYLAHHEMTEVLDLDPELEDLLQSNGKNITLLFAEKDGWIPDGFIEQLKTSFPLVNIEMDRNGATHAFCVAHSIPVAHWLKNLLPKQEATSSTTTLPQ